MFSLALGTTGSRFLKMTRVVYWNNIPAPYMVDRFNALAARGNLEFEAWFSARSLSHRSWTVDESRWHFEYRYLPNFERQAPLLAAPLPLLGRRGLDLLVTLYAAPAFLPAWMAARTRGARTAIWVEVTHPAWVTRRRWKEALKASIFPRVDAILTPGEDGRAFARRYGGSNERIHCVPHVIDAARFSEASIAGDERELFRHQLGLRGVTFAYVGRLYVEKGLLFLIDAFAELQRSTTEDVSLLFVGDGPDEAYIRERSATAGIRNVVFCGFQHSDLLPRFYSAADAFVFPTLGEPFGMVVLEAMACGLPVVATTTTGEIATRVTDGVNGFIVEPADSKALLDRMTTLASDQELRRRMGRASSQRVADQTPEIWAVAFEAAVEKVLATPRAGRIITRPAA
jgi:glycosyltransferase involved in cell wall biosynthesis